MLGVMAGEPEAGRPYMPSEYGLPEPGKPLPWNWAAERLTRSQNYWLATTRSDGRPHLMIVWGVWLDGRFWFSTSRNSVKGRNLAANPACVVSTEDAREAVIVEGVVEESADKALLREFSEAYVRKYKESAEVSQSVVYAVRPRVAFGFISDPEQWAETATRWRFPG